MDVEKMLPDQGLVLAVCVVSTVLLIVAFAVVRSTRW
jgi:hypothetical protein